MNRFIREPEALELEASVSKFILPHIAALGADPSEERGIRQVFAFIVTAWAQEGQVIDGIGAAVLVGFDMAALDLSRSPAGPAAPFGQFILRTVEDTQLTHPIRKPMICDRLPGGHGVAPFLLWHLGNPCGDSDAALDLRQIRIDLCGYVAYMSGHDLNLTGEKP